MMHNQFPKKLILLRKYYNYSQQDLANKLNVSLEEYMKFENGSSLCTMVQLLKLSKILKVDLDDLFDNTVEIKDFESDDIDIPFQDSLNKPKPESDIEKTIITKVVSENQIEEVDDGKTIVLKAPLTEKKKIEEIIPEKPKKKVPVPLIVGITTVVVLVIGFAITAMLMQSKSSVKNVLTANSRLVAAQRFSAYLSDKGVLIKHGSSLDTSEFTDVVQISARQNVIAGLNSDGSVVCSGNNCDSSKMKDVISISAGNSHILALLKDKSVVCTGSTTACDVETFKEVDTIYAGNNESYAIKDGKVLYVGNSVIKSDIESLTNVQQIATSSNFFAALTKDGKVIALPFKTAKIDTSSFLNVTQIAVGNDFIVALQNDGSVKAVGNEEIIKEVEKWQNIQSVAAYDNYVIGVNRSNIIYGAGDNTYQQYEKIETTEEKKLEKVKLNSAQSLNFSESNKGLLITWTPVDNADYYQVSINVGGSFTVKVSTASLSVDAEKLTANTEYMISIVAYPKDNDTYEPSDVAVYNYKYIGASVASKQHTVIFYDNDGKTELSHQIVDDGASATAPISPTKQGYTFKGWSTSFDTVTKDTYIYAQYEINHYVIRFLDADKITVLNRLDLSYGDKITLPNPPTKTNSIFKEWTPAVDATATNNQDYVAIYACSITNGVLNTDGSCGCSTGNTLKDGACVVNESGENP